ncbi:hypothetical protein E4K67_12000 [Desulfosporosinus fructosivorans]|uniref:Uncharacterized protein n=1 Tax=Desulfosporosinus fructosivorans TaxID=2018669 RepID=A0A4Z0R8F3_9FIRM|nr:hypothetical protein E4K67_12000 [Desulfosporosinus fructosivorans]
MLNNQPEPAIFSETHQLLSLEMVSSEKIQQAFTRWVEEIRDWAKGNAYLVGHIKLFVDGQENLWLSSTGKNINIKHSQGWSKWSTDRINLSVTAIIFGPAKEVLGEEARERLQACLKGIFSEVNSACLFPVILGKG